MCRLWCFAHQCIFSAVKQELSCAFGARGTSLLLVQNRSTQEKTTPRLALAGHRATAPALPQLRHPCRRLPVKSVSRGLAFRQHIHVRAKRSRPPVDSRCAACRPRLTAAQGPRVEQRAIVARTLQRSRSRAKTAVHGRRHGATIYPPPVRNALQESVLRVCYRPRLCENSLIR